MVRSFSKFEYFEPWLQFKEPVVRQLAFCLSSPNIIKRIPAELSINYHFDLHNADFWQQQFTFYQKRLFELDQRPNPLLNFLNQLKSTRLGLRFEYLLWFWLLDRNYHAYQLLGHSIQKIDGAKTLGELDFVVLNTDTNEIEHWEVALKYYLGEANLSLSSWFGLNRDDTLSKKLSHFTQRQFQFKQVNHYQIQKRYAVLKGQLYLPEALLNTEINLEWLEPQRRIGQWGHKIKQSYYRLSRHEWLCPNHSPSSQDAIWWTNGLYTSSDYPSNYYMYRQQLLNYN